MSYERPRLLWMERKRIPLLLLGHRLGTHSMPLSKVKAEYASLLAYSGNIEGHTRMLTPTVKSLSLVRLISHNRTASATTFSCPLSSNFGTVESG